MPRKSHPPTFPVRFVIEIDDELALQLARIQERLDLPSRARTVRTCIALTYACLVARGEKNGAGPLV